MRMLSAALFGMILMGFSTLPGKRVLVIDTESRLIINGKTNVNSFACKTSGYKRRDTIEYEQNGTETIMLRNSLVLPVADFDCGIEAITNDFLEALNHKKYPNLEIHFMSLDGIDGADGQAQVRGKVNILLSGMSKTYDITFNSSFNNGTLLLTGRQPALFKDFGLTPPRKMMGMIQVKEDLDVEFYIKLRELR